MTHTHTITKKVYTETGISEKAVVIKTGDEKGTVKYFNELISRIRAKADKCSDACNPNGYKFKWITGKKAQATINGNIIVFAIKRVA